MASARIEHAEWINPKTVERAYFEANNAQTAGNELRRKRLAEGGMRAARARDPKLMLVLEKSAEILNQLAENQHGRTRRDQNTCHSERTELTEYTMWREAYKAADRGEPVVQLALIYGVAAEMAGLI